LKILNGSLWRLPITTTYSPGGLMANEIDMPTQTRLCRDHPEGASIADIMENHQMVCSASPIPAQPTPSRSGEGR
jgi:hypothetical protein